MTLDICGIHLLVIGDIVVVVVLQALGVQVGVAVMAALAGISIVLAAQLDLIFREQRLQNLKGAFRSDEEIQAARRSFNMGVTIKRIIGYGLVVAAFMLWLLGVNR